MIGSTCLADSGNNKDCEVDGFSFLNNSDIEIILFGISPLIKKKNGLEFGTDSGKMVE